MLCGNYSVYAAVPGAACTCTLVFGMPQQLAAVGDERQSRKATG